MFYIISSIIIPDNTPTKYKIPTIFKFSKKCLLVLNNIIIAIPLPVNKPLIKLPKLIALFIYNSVNITLAPQLGISPIKLDINGPKKLSLSNILDK